MESRESGYGSMVSNEGYNSFNVLRARLDCTPLYEQIERFLRGDMPVMKRDPDTGELYLTYERTEGGQKCNEKGIQAILNTIISKLNSQVVQGNLTVQRYELLVSEYRLSFTRMIVFNCVKFEIQDSELEFIIDYVMDMIEMFLTRLIDNKERDSYAQTFKSTESNVYKENDNKFKLFKRNEQ